MLLAALTASAFGAGAWWWRHVTVPSQAEVDEAGERASEAFVEARRMRCPRPVLRGTAAAGDGAAALREALVAEGPFSECLELHRDVAAPPSIDDTLRACVGLDATVRAALQHESLCTPFPLGDEPQNLLWWVRVSAALSSVARGRAERGAVREAAEILLDAIRLGDDLTRGRPTFLVAMLSCPRRTRRALGALPPNPVLRFDPEKEGFFLGLSAWRCDVARQSS